MSTTAPVSGAPLPEDSDDFDEALDVAATGLGLDSYVVGRFANTGLRDTGRPVPATGMLDSIAGTPVVRRANAWRPVDIAGSWYGEANGTPPRTLSSLATDITVTGTGVTITLIEQRRIRVAFHGAIVQGTATQGRWKVWPTYVSGAMGPGGTVFGNGSTVSGVGSGEYSDFTGSGTVVLAAGVWSLFLTAQRLANGATSDTIAASHIEVLDAGPS